MPERPKELQLLFKVFDDLHDFLPYLVLVGGWVPYLYAQYLWKGVLHEPMTTIDIDFGFKDAPEGNLETIADRVMKMSYREHHVSTDRSTPFVPVVYIAKGDLKADVEFITTLQTPERVKQKLVGNEIKINEIKDFEILFQATIKINVDGRSVRVPNPSIFTFHKILTFPQRERIDKQQKDLYYAYYVLFFSPDREKLTKEVSSLIRESKAGHRVKANIEKYFEDIHAKGPAFILESTGGSAIRTLVSDPRRDAYERIIALIGK